MIEIKDDLGSAKLGLDTCIHANPNAEGMRFSLHRGNGNHKKRVAEHIIPWGVIYETLVAKEE